MNNSYYFNNPNYTKIEGYIPNINKSGRIIVNESFGTGGKRTAGGQICGLVEGISVSPKQNFSSYALIAGASMLGSAIGVFTFKFGEKVIKNIYHKIKNNKKTKTSKEQKKKSTDWIEMELDTEERGGAPSSRLSQLQ